MRSAILVACLAAASLMFGQRMFGQSDQGSIIGIVSDPRARLIQHARVDARNVDTGNQYSAESNDSGQYRITGLPVGTYEVSIDLPHFERVAVEGVKAGELKPSRVDLILKPK
jgi:hypothetical protein